MGRLLPQTAQLQPRGGGEPAIQRKSAGIGVIQRLKKGDFAEFKSFGLDVGTWVEFADAVKKLGLYGLAVVSWRLEQWQQAKGINLDTIRAKMLVDRRKFELRGPSNSLFDRYYSPKGTPKQQEEGPSNKKEKQEPRIVIGDMVAESTPISSASDLLVWLVSHPTGSTKTPGDFADSKTLLKVLDKLGKVNRLIEPPEVWAVLREVVAAQESDDEESGNNEPDSEQSSARWPEGEWGQEHDKDAHVDFESPLAFKRKMSAEHYQKELKALSARLAGYKFVGVHATKLENLGSLMVEGVSRDKFGTGHGVGKGNGFYIIPAQGKKGVPDADKTEQSAQLWGTFVVAVYLPQDCALAAAHAGENVQTLEERNKKEDPGKKFYYQFGKEEVVIPPSLCNEVILVRDPADITMADPGLPAEPIKGKQSALGFIKNLHKT